ncbi:hypothetical protein MC7420_1021 [Coleofasciculus chthonoplastes PCC 7420]|uniref:Uncharacterized protein n=1 Tax=Coleofasciculus chthonoplastes PCC 7420 TaxID=118168 RepID=B4W0D8_9CYAN|nr:hypothetical protein MC7420_1021 [Coleofasciculus chthonoplastes PCC 7420]
MHPDLTKPAPTQMFRLPLKTKNDPFKLNRYNCQFMPAGRPYRRILLERQILIQFNQYPSTTTQQLMTK